MSNEAKSLSQLQPLLSLEAKIGGLSLAPESRNIVLWGTETLAVAGFDGQVRRQVSVPGPGSLVAAASDVTAGAVYVIHSRHGLARLTGNLKYEWDKAIGRPVSVTTTPFGEYVLVGTADRELFVFDCYGRKVAKKGVVRPPHQLTVAAAEEAVFVAGDSTILARYDIRLREIWEEQIVSPIGPLATPGNALYLLVCTFTYGLQRYRGDGVCEGTYHVRNGVRLVDVDFDGSTIVTATLDDYVVLLDAVGVIRQEVRLPFDDPVALRLVPSGKQLFLAADRTLYTMAISPAT